MPTIPHPGSLGSRFVFAFWLTAAVTAGSSANAQSAADDPDEAQDAVVLTDVIVVTGERFPRTVNETAASVFVETAETMGSRAGGDDVNDFLELIPNLQVSGNQNNGPTLRGQNSTGVLSGINAFFGGSRQRSTILLDGRPLSYNEFIYGPTGLWDVERIEVFLGPQTTAQGPDSIAGAIYVNTKDPAYDPEAALRASGGNFDMRQLSGMANLPLIDNELAVRAAVDIRNHDSFLDYAFPEEDIGADRVEDAYLSARIKLLWEPDTLPGLRADFSYHYADTQGPQSENLQPPFEDRVRSVPGVSVFETESHAVVASLSYTLNNALTLSNRLTYADTDIDRRAPAGQGVSKISREEITNETLLTFTPDNERLSGVTGLYLQSFDADEAIDLAAFLLGDGSFTDKVTTLGVFGELTYSLTDRLHLTGGVRYQEASQDRDGGFAPLPPVDFDETFSAWLPKAGVAYDLSESVRVGFEARRGFNPGGVTLSFFTGQLDTFDEETVWSYEFYARSALLGGRLQLNGNLFFTDFSDAQRPVNVVVPGGVITELAKAEEARSYGVEVQAHWQATSNLAFAAALGVLETELERVSLDPTQEGKEFERAPGASASFAIEYAPTEQWMLNVQGRYTDDYFSDDANTALTAVDSFFIADAKVSYSYGKATLFAYATNVFDEFTTLQQFGPNTAVVVDPREWGVGIELRF